MKKGFIVALGVLTALCFTGCGKKDKAKPALATPTNLSVQADGENTYIIFNEVANADYYTISINDMSVTIEDGEESTLKYNASNIITQPKNYTIKVKAEGDKYTSSQYSIEYKYYYKVNLIAPTLVKDGNIINWARVSNADYYEVQFSSDLINKTYITSTNSFNVTNLITNAGKYSIKVRSLSDNEGYITSDFSNVVEYVTTSQLEPANNLVINNINNELLLSFVTEQDVDGIELEVNNKTYSLSVDNLSAVCIDNNISNMYTIKLSTLLTANGDMITEIVNARVKLVSSNEYISNSNFSNFASYQFSSVLPTPTATLVVDGDNAILNINNVSNEDLMGYNVYIGNTKYKTITSDISLIQISLSEINNLPIYIQSVSNNQLVCNSLLSEALWSESYTSLATAEINYNNQILSYAVQNAEMYCVEIYNNTFSTTIFTTNSSLDLTNIAPNMYNVRVSAIANGKISVTTSSITHVVKLETIDDLTIDTLINIGVLTFSPVDNAYGYIMYIDGVKLDKLFTTNNIDLAEYVNELGNYEIEIKAIGCVNGMFVDSELSNKVEFTKSVTLSKPALSFTEQDDKVYLNINIDENESDKATKCILWTNYESQEIEFEDAQFDITSLVESVGSHTFIIQTVADNNAFINNSSVNTISYITTKQLQEVSNINLSQAGEKILLTFDEQAEASKYLINITNSQGDVSSIETSLGICDITSLVNNTSCSVSIKAVAKAGGWYLDSNVVQKTFA